MEMEKQYLEYLAKNMLKNKEIVSGIVKYFTTEVDLTDLSEIASKYKLLTFSEYKNQKTI